MPRGKVKIVAPDQGVDLTTNPEALALEQWTSARHVRFLNGRALRWGGYGNWDGVADGQPTSVETVLKVFDYVVNASTRILIVVTTSHVWRYVASDGKFYPIDVDNGVLNYTTGTVTTTSTGVTGAGGADFVVAGIAVGDIIQVTNLATPDSKFRRVTGVTDATHLTTEPQWGTLEAGRTYAIKRPRYLYTLAERPWALGYQGELFISSLSGNFIVYWGGTANQMSLISSHSGYVAPTGATKVTSRDAFVLANHLVLVYTDIGGATTEPRTLRWTDIGEPADFTDTGLPSEGGFLGIEDTQEDLVGGAKLGELGIVYARDSIHALSYVGGDFVFVRKQLTANFGLFAREGLAVLNDRHLFVGTDDFYALSNGGIESIGGPVRDSFFAEVDRASAHVVSSTINETMTEWIIAYRSLNASGTYADKLLVFNYRTGAWATGTAAQFSALGRAKVQDSGGATVINDITDDVEDFIEPYDSASAGSIEPKVFAGTGASTTEVAKIVAFEDQGSFSSTLERTGLRLTDDPTLVQFLDGVWFYFDASKSSGVVRLTVGARDSSDTAYVWGTPFDYTVGSSDGFVPVDVRGREFGIRIETVVALGTATFALTQVVLEGYIGSDR